MFTFTRRNLSRSTLVISCRQTRCDFHTLWIHCPGSENPAYILSRGLYAHDLSTCTTWWNGPVWLRDAPDNWPRDVHTDHASVPEKRNMPRQPLTVSTRTPLLQAHKCSSSTELLRVVAWILLFLRNLREAEKTLGELKTSNLQASRNQLLQMVQRDSSCGLWNSSPSPTTTDIFQDHMFQPFCEHKLILLGGRHHFADLSHRKASHSFGRIPPCYTLVDPPYPYPIAPFSRPRCTIPPQTWVLDSPSTTEHQKGFTRLLTM